MRKFKFFILAGVLLTISACSTGSNSGQNYNNQSQAQGNEASEGNVAEFTRPTIERAREPDYKTAATINSQLVIIYTNEGLLDRAKGKLIKAQELNEEHDYNLAIVDYAAGIYYQTIGSYRVAEENYQRALKYHSEDFEAINFYAQYLCSIRRDYATATKMFEKSLFLSSNSDMAQTLFLYSECLYKQGKKIDAAETMERATKFRTDYSAAVLRLAEMYYEQEDYRKSYKVLYGMSEDDEFFNNIRVLELRLKLAERARNRNEAAKVRLILSSKNYNDTNIENFFSASDGSDIDEQ